MYFVYRQLRRVCEPKSEPLLNQSSDERPSPKPQAPKSPPASSLDVSEQNFRVRSLPDCTALRCTCPWVPTSFPTVSTACLELGLDCLVKLARGKDSSILQLYSKARLFRGSSVECRQTWPAAALLLFLLQSSASVRVYPHMLSMR